MPILIMHGKVSLINIPLLRGTSRNPKHPIVILHSAPQWLMMNESTLTSSNS